MSNKVRSKQKENSKQKVKKKHKLKIGQKIWLFLSKQYYLYFAIAVVSAVTVILIAVNTGKLGLTDVIELSAFSAVVLESLLKAVTEYIRKIALNKVEDPSKLTTNYEGLVKTYEESKSKMVIGSDGKPIPVVVEALLDDKQIVINDDSEFEYELPELIVRNYTKLFSAHDTSNTYNNINVRVNDWRLSGNKFTIFTGRTTYFNSLVTNRAMDYEIEKGMTVRKLYEFGAFIRPISKSSLSNHIGFNGFIESADGYFAFIYRAKDVSIGKRTWGNSIGASLKSKIALDPETHILSEKGLENGILVEIKHEMNLDRENLDNIGTQFDQLVIISAYRDLVEGGKPQLMIYARSTLNHDKISERFKNGNKKIEQEAKEEENDRTKQEIEMRSDGKRIEWISKNDLMKNLEIYSGKLVYKGKDMKMMPSATACVQMLKDYLKRKACSKN